MTTHPRLDSDIFAAARKALDDDPNVPQDVRNIFDESGEWARSSFDHRHVFVASGSYQLPFFDGAGGFKEAALGGWRVNAVYFMQSGAPFTVNLGVGLIAVIAGISIATTSGTSRVSRGSVSAPLSAKPMRPRRPT